MENAAIFIEALAVIIIVFAIVGALVRYMVRYSIKGECGDLYHQLKVSLGMALLLVLEILVAADVIHTVALEAMLESVIVLGLLVLIRTILSWALVVEIEGALAMEARAGTRRVQQLKTPRAADVTGVAFELLFAVAVVLIRTIVHDNLPSGTNWIDRVPDS